MRFAEEVLAEAKMDKCINFFILPAKFGFEEVEELFQTRQPRSIFSSDDNKPRHASQEDVRQQLVAITNVLIIERLQLGKLYQQPLDQGGHYSTPCSRSASSSRGGATTMRPLSISMRGTVSLVKASSMVSPPGCAISITSLAP